MNLKTVKPGIKNARELMCICESIEQMQAQAAYYKNVYFWDSPGNAAGRRSFEQRHGAEIGFDNKALGARAHLSIELSCSCKHIYKHQTTTYNGEECTMGKLTGLKKRIENLFEKDPKWAKAKAKVIERRAAKQIAKEAA